MATSRGAPAAFAANTEQTTDAGFRRMFVGQELMVAKTLTHPQL